MKSCTLLLLFLFILPSAYAEKLNLSADQLQTLSQSDEWSKLLYFKGSFWGKDQSEIDSKNFFLSDEQTPKEELKALALKLETNPKLHCQFPARTKWLYQKLNQKQPSFRGCSKYQDFYQFMIPEKVYLVFSSYFLESPGSAFGHTFLRFSKKSNLTESQRGELLDLGINYGAAVTTDNPVLYSLMGMMGGFDGVYSSLPYYHKVREYNNFESRDLWSYELNLSTREKERLVDHLWELSQTRSSYFFFSENCSYRVLKAIEAAKPQIDIVKNLPYGVIPADTIKGLASEKDLIKSIHFRASVKTTFENSLKQLSEKEKDLLSDFLEEKNFKSVESEEKQIQANVFDVALDYIDFKFSSDVMAKKGEGYDLKQKILRKRAKLPRIAIDQNVPMPKSQQPHLGHKSGRATLRAGDNKELGFYEELELRMAFHDLLDSVMGQPELAEITFFSFRGRYYHDQKSIQFERWTLAEVSTLNPVGFKHYPLSLNARIGVERIRNSSCDNCLAPLLKFGSGMTKTFSDHRYLFSFFIDNEFSQDDSYKKSHFRYSLGPSAQALLRWHPKVSQLAKVGWQRHILQEEDDWYVDHRLRANLFSSFSLEASNRLLEKHAEHQLSLMYFF